MYYKEWRVVRIKVGILMILYGVFAFYVISVLVLIRNVFSASGSRGYILEAWVGASFLITVLGGLLGGGDSISGELRENTLSFLLTRPLSRKQIYSTKILANIAGLGIAYGSCTVIVLIVDIVVNAGQLPPISNFTALLTQFTLGMLITCVSSLVSVFSSNPIITLLLSIVANLLLFPLYYLVGFLINLVEPESLKILGKAISPLLLVGFSYLFYRLGLFFFQRKEF